MSSPIPIKKSRPIFTDSPFPHEYATSTEGDRLRYEYATWAMYELITEARRRISPRSSVVTTESIHRPKAIRAEELVGEEMWQNTTSHVLPQVTFQSEDAIFELEL